MMVHDHLPVESVIEIMIDRKARGPPTLPAVLVELVDKMLDKEDDFTITMARSCIYNKAKQFYKAALHRPANLRRNLIVSFYDEEGVDVGALRMDLFLASLRGFCEELFEGRENRLLPRSYWGSENDFEMAGAA